MKKLMMAVGWFMYCTWYGAAVVFVAVAAVLSGLQFANCCMGDLVPWPKYVHLLIMFATVANIGVAMIVSLCRRKWGRAIGLLLLCVAAYVGFAFVAFISYCVPTRMAMPPSREWTEATICQPSAIEYDNLTFLGGISTRETVAVFAVADTPLDKSRFVDGSPWTDEVGDKALASYRRIMAFCRIDVPLPDVAALSYCDGRDGNITLIEANCKTYLVYQRL
ncbi:MAG: hypothetical protein IJI36_19350 [Kiritimatiellae bacterium]|nr:hypothetical protein [Kiritimatiellia bacterium]